MITWQYNPEQYNEKNNSLLAEGNYEVRITCAHETMSRNGTKGLEITLELKGEYTKLKHFIWYNHDYEMRTNQLLGEFFNSFDISESERDHIETWIGKDGAVYVMHDVYKGRTIAKVGFCIAREYQKDIQKWYEKSSDHNPGKDTPTANDKPDLSEYLSNWGPVPKAYR